MWHTSGYIFMKTLKMEEVIELSSGSDSEESTSGRFAKDERFREIWKKAKDLIFLRTSSSNDYVFPYASFKQVIELFLRKLDETQAKTLKLFVYRKILHLIQAVKSAFSGIEHDEKFNFLLIDFMVSYINYKCEQTENVQDANNAISELLTVLHVVFSGKNHFIIMTLLKIEAKKEHAHVLYDVYKKHLSDRRCYSSNDIISYIRLILGFRKWKLLVSDKNDKININRIAEGRAEKAVSSEGKESYKLIDKGILPLKVPPVDNANLLFAKISDLIGFAIDNGNKGTSILLRNGSIDLNEAIGKFFKQYEDYINRDVDEKLCESTRLLSVCQGSKESFFNELIDDNHQDDDPSGEICMDVEKETNSHRLTTENRGLQFGLGHRNVAAVEHLRNTICDTKNNSSSNFNDSGKVICSDKSINQFNNRRTVKYCRLSRTAGRLRVIGESKAKGKKEIIIISSESSSDDEENVESCEDEVSSTTYLDNQNLYNNTQNTEHSCDQSPRNLEVESSGLPWEDEKSIGEKLISISLHNWPDETQPISQKSVTDCASLNKSKLNFVPRNSPLLSPKCFTPGESNSLSSDNCNRNTCKMDAPKANQNKSLIPIIPLASAEVSSSAIESSNSPVQSISQTTSTNRETQVSTNIEKPSDLIFQQQTSTNILSAAPVETGKKDLDEMISCDSQMSERNMRVEKNTEINGASVEKIVEHLKKTETNNAFNLPEVNAEMNYATTSQHTRTNSTGVDDLVREQQIDNSDRVITDAANTHLSSETESKSDKGLKQLKIISQTDRADETKSVLKCDHKYESNEEKNPSIASPKKPKYNHEPLLNEYQSFEKVSYQHVNKIGIESSNLDEECASQPLITSVDEKQNPIKCSDETSIAGILQKEAIESSVEVTISFEDKSVETGLDSVAKGEEVKMSPENVRDSEDNTQAGNYCKINISPQSSVLQHSDTAHCSDESSFLTSSKLQRVPFKMFENKKTKKFLKKPSMKSNTSKATDENATIALKSKPEVWTNLVVDLSIHTVREEEKSSETPKSLMDLEENGKIISSENAQFSNKTSFGIPAISDLSKNNKSCDSLNNFCETGKIQRIINLCQESSLPSDSLSSANRNIDENVKVIPKENALQLSLKEESEKLSYLNTPFKVRLKRRLSLCSNKYDCFDDLSGNLANITPNENANDSLSELCDKKEATHSLTASECDNCSDTKEDKIIQNSESNRPVPSEDFLTQLLLTRIDHVLDDASYQTSSSKKVEHPGSKKGTENFHKRNVSDNSKAEMKSENCNDNGNEKTDDYNLKVLVSAIDLRSPTDLAKPPPTLLDTCRQLSKKVVQSLADQTPSKKDNPVKSPEVKPKSALKSTNSPRALNTKKTRFDSHATVISGLKPDPLILDRIPISDKESALLEKNTKTSRSRLGNNKRENCKNIEVVAWNMRRKQIKRPKEKIIPALSVLPENCNYMASPTISTKFTENERSEKEKRYEGSMKTVKSKASKGNKQSEDSIRKLQLGSNNGDVNSKAYIDGRNKETANFRKATETLVTESKKSDKSNILDKIFKKPELDVRLIVNSIKNGEESLPQGCHALSTNIEDSHIKVSTERKDNTNKFDQLKDEGLSREHTVVDIHNVNNTKDKNNIDIQKFLKDAPIIDPQKLNVSGDSYDAKNKATYNLVTPSDSNGLTSLKGPKLAEYCYSDKSSKSVIRSSSNCDIINNSSIGNEHERNSNDSEEFSDLTKESNERKQHKNSHHMISILNEKTCVANSPQEAGDISRQLNEEKTLKDSAIVDKHSATILIAQIDDNKILMKSPNRSDLVKEQSLGFSIAASKYANINKSNEIVEIFDQLKVQKETSTKHSITKTHDLTSSDAFQILKDQSSLKPTSTVDYYQIGSTQIFDQLNRTKVSEDLLTFESSKRDDSRIESSEDNILQGNAELTLKGIEVRSSKSENVLNETKQKSVSHIIKNTSQGVENNVGLSEKSTFSTETPDINKQAEKHLSLNKSKATKTSPSAIEILVVTKEDDKRKKLNETTPSKKSIENRSFKTNKEQTTMKYPKGSLLPKIKSWDSIETYSKCIRSADESGMKSPSSTPTKSDEEDAEQKTKNFEDIITKNISQGISSYQNTENSKSISIKPCFVKMRNAKVFQDDAATQDVISTPKRKSEINNDSDNIQEIETKKARKTDDKIGNGVEINSDDVSGAKIDTQWDHEDKIVRQSIENLDLPKLKNEVESLLEALTSISKTPSVEAYFIINKIIVNFIYECLSYEDCSRETYCRLYHYICERAKKLQDENIDNERLEIIENKYQELKKIARKLYSLKVIQQLDVFLDSFKSVKMNLFTPKWLRENKSNIQRHMRMVPVEHALLIKVKNQQDQLQANEAQEKFISDDHSNLNDSNSPTSNQIHKPMTAEYYQDSCGGVYQRDKTPDQEQEDCSLASSDKCSTLSASPRPDKRFIEFDLPSPNPNQLSQSNVSDVVLCDANDSDCDFDSTFTYTMGKLYALSSLDVMPDVFNSSGDVSPEMKLPSNNLDDNGPIVLPPEKISGGCIDMPDVLDNIQTTFREFPSNKRISNGVRIDSFYHLENPLECVGGLSQLDDNSMSHYFQTNIHDLNESLTSVNPNYIMTSNSSSRDGTASAIDDTVEPFTLDLPSEEPTFEDLLRQDTDEFITTNKNDNIVCRSSSESVNSFNRDVIEISSTRSEQNINITSKSTKKEVNIHNDKSSSSQQKTETPTNTKANKNDDAKSSPPSTIKKSDKSKSNTNSPNKKPKRETTPASVSMSCHEVASSTTLAKIFKILAPKPFWKRTQKQLSKSLTSDDGEDNINRNSDSLKKSPSNKLQENKFDDRDILEGFGNVHFNKQEKSDCCSAHNTVQKRDISAIKPAVRSDDLKLDVTKNTQSIKTHSKDVTKEAFNKNTNLSTIDTKNSSINNIPETNLRTIRTSIERVQIDYLDGERCGIIHVEPHSTSVKAVTKKQSSDCNNYARFEAYSNNFRALNSKVSDTINVVTKATTSNDVKREPQASASSKHNYNLSIGDTNLSTLRSFRRDYQSLGSQESTFRNRKQFPREPLSSTISSPVSNQPKVTVNENNHESGVKRMAAFDPHPISNEELLEYFAKQKKLKTENHSNY